MNDKRKDDLKMGQNLNNPYILAVIPARGGSKRLPGKNIMSLAGKPLIDYVIRAASQSRKIDDFLVSTDSAKIKNVAENCGALVPFIRPSELAEDFTTSEDVLRHTVNFWEGKKGQAIDIVVLLQVTSPFTTADLIDECISLLCFQKFRSVITVQKAPASCQWVGRLEKDNNFKYTFSKEDDGHILKQEEYIPSGNVYVITREALFEQSSIVGDSTGVVVVDDQTAVDIDYQIDFDFAEFLIKQKKMDGKKNG